MIYLGNLSSEEKKAIEELRKRMKKDAPQHILEDTALLYRFLKARDFHMENAENMLRKHISWRKHFQIDNILEDFTPRQFFKKYIKLSDVGLDKSGNVLKYIPLGKLDLREVAKCVQINEYMKHWIWHFEEIGQDVKKLNQEPDKALQVTFIINLDKLTLGNTTSETSIEICMRFMHLVQDNYPETLNAAYIINAPNYYIFIFSILKKMMSNSMIQKFHIYGYNGWRNKLLEVVDADVLPKFLGGNRTDHDGNPLCTTFIKHGGTIPESYYLLKEERDFTNKSQVRRITIPSKNRKEISFNVTETGSQIHWEFLIKSKDIGFGIFYKTAKSELEEVLPIQKYDTIDGVEKGSYKSQGNGNYVIVFDNSYSWWHSKEVDYCITVSKEEP